MAVYRRGKVWWYKFNWNGEPIRHSTKQSNKRVAEQMEAAHRTSLAKGEVGIRDRAPVPTLRDFAEKDFKPYIESRFPNKPKTLEYYRTGLKNLNGYAPLAGCALDTITAERISGFVTKRREAGLEVSSINRQLEVLRRMLKLAVEWGKVEKALPKVEMLPGENHRDRVLSADEEAGYLEAATAIGEDILESYRCALEGIRATKRNEEPIQPDDPFLLRDAATVLVDCALRPEECFRLRWEHLRDGAVHVPFGKTENARRTIPLTPRAASLLEMLAFGDAARGGEKRMGLSGSDPERAYREIQPQEAAPQGVQTGEGGSLPALYLPAYLLNAVGGLHGPVHSWIPSWTRRLLYDAALRSPAGAHDHGSD
jgi:integrase